MAIPVILQELLPDFSSGRQVRLENHSLPEEGVTEARELAIERRAYPGGSFVETQALGLSDDDLTLEGWLRLPHSNAAVGEAIRTVLLDFQRLARPIWLSWGDTWGRLVTLKRVEFPRQNQALRYRLLLAHLELAEESAPAPVVADPQAILRSLDNLGQRITVLEQIQRAVSL